MQLSERVLAADGLGGRILKVDHAGENGAVHIYSGQLLCARITAPALVPELLEFRAHEQRHRQVFADELQRRGLRPCRSYALCALGGFALGVITGLFGRGAIAATTVAVERVVLRHLGEQIGELDGRDTEAADAVRSIVAEEQQHHDHARLQADASRLWLALLARVVAAATEIVIWTGMRL